MSMDSSVKTPSSNAISDKMNEKGDKTNNIIAMGGSAKRQTLQVLQVKAEKHSAKKAETETNTLIGRDSGGFMKLFTKEKSASKRSEKPPKIFEDSPSIANSAISAISPEPKPLKVTTTYTQTKLAGSDILEFERMIQPGAEFYKDLAEKRREALNESLKENEELWIENEEQKEKVKTLEDKVHSLEETVEKARKISELLEPYLDLECDESLREVLEPYVNTECDQLEGKNKDQALTPGENGVKARKISESLEPYLIPECDKQVNKDREDEVHSLEETVEKGTKISESQEPYLFSECDESACKVLEPYITPECDEQVNKDREDKD